MTGTDADRSHQPGSQGCHAEVVAGVALDGDAVLLAKRAAIKSVAPNQLHLPGGGQLVNPGGDVAETEEARRRADKKSLAGWQKLIGRREMTS